MKDEKEEKRDLLARYFQADTCLPFYLTGDALEQLQRFPANSIDCIITSPPYFQKRVYLAGGLGQEKNYGEYIENLLKITAQLHRILKPSGSLWLNMGDSYQKKQLLNLPYRMAIQMQDKQGWILRNTVIWDKLKGAMSSSKDSMPSQYEPIFHFVKEKRNYYYDADAIRRLPGRSQVDKGRVKSATGVSGICYRRKIEHSQHLSAEQKKQAIKELEETLDQIRQGSLYDFRMVLKGENRMTHGDCARLSSRARELEEKGFYFLRYHPDGGMISDVWQIVPEDTRGRTLHFASYPEDLIKTPVILTCPEKGVVLDPFVGTGTTCAAAMDLGRKSIGIDIAEVYIRMARERTDSYCDL